MEELDCFYMFKLASKSSGPFETHPIICRGWKFYIGATSCWLLNYCSIRTSKTHLPFFLSHPPFIPIYIFVIISSLSLSLSNYGHGATKGFSTLGLKAFASNVTTPSHPKPKYNMGFLFHNVGYNWALSQECFGSIHLVRWRARVRERESQWWILII